jgi:hypothetical protein
METTCPSCRHVVDLGEGTPRKCPNCGDVVYPPTSLTPPTAAPATEAAEADLPTSPLEPTSPNGVAQPHTRAAPVVSFICGLLFCIPFVPQLVGLGVAVFALLRRRRPEERVGLAWAGLVLCLVAVGVWALVVGVARTRMLATGPVVLPPPAPTYTDDVWEASELADQMTRIHQAASAYHRDYNKWPPDIVPLRGRALPAGFRMSPRLTYRPVPPGEAFSMDWVLIVSEPLKFDQDGEPLDQPHRLLLRLNGRIDAHPEAEAQNLLRSQQPDAGADSPSPTTAPDDRD